MNTEDINREDISREEYLLNQIIASCELVLDRIALGTNLNESEFNQLGYVDSAMQKISQSIEKRFDFEIIEDIRKYQDN
jgi:hypothetical protein